MITIIMTAKNIYAALLAAAVVGTLLNLINSYDVFWQGKFTGRNIMRIVLTYVSPFCVSLYSSIKSVKENSN